MDSLKYVRLGTIALLFFMGLPTFANSQDTLIMPVNGNGGIYNTCNAIIFDSGLDSNYSNETNSSITIAPLWVSQVNLEFEIFDTENFFDTLTIYDGPGLSFPKIGTFSGNSLSGAIIQSTQNAITLQFTTDDILVKSGFKIKVSCLVGIDENTNNTYLAPNPAINTFSIVTDNHSAIQSITIYDVSGKEIDTIINTSTHIDVSLLPPGIYIVSIQMNDKRKTNVRLLKV